jgi:pilus assembly protein CpaB
MDRQRVLLIFGIAWISAALLTWFLWSRTKAPQKERSVRVVAAARDMAAGTRLQKGDLKVISMPEKDLPRAALLDAKVAEGRALLYPVTANEPVTTPKLSTTTGADGLPATIPPGYRAISVPVTDISGVAGLLQPRSRVDVLFTRAGAMAEALTTVVVEDVAVLSIGRNTEITQAPPQPPGGSGTPTNINPSQQRAVSLLVTPQEAGKLELAKNQGRLSLALRNPLDKGRMEKREAVTAEALDPELFTRVRRPTMVGGRPGAPVDVRDPNVWAQLTGQGPPPKKEEKKEPPKPRLVVDVYRGDKHLQETFHQ